MAATAQEPTALLVAWGHGDQAAFDALMPLVHDELHQIARRQMAGERPGHTLQATALVNEAYLRLIEVKRMDWQNRAHFFAMAARVMRRILVNAALARMPGRRPDAPTLPEHLDAWLSHRQRLLVSRAGGALG